MVFGVWDLFFWHASSRQRGEDTGKRMTLWGHSVHDLEIRRWLRWHCFNILIIRNGASMGFESMLICVGSSSKFFPLAFVNLDRYSVQLPWHLLLHKWSLWSLKLCWRTPLSKFVCERLECCYMVWNNEERLPRGLEKEVIFLVGT